MNERGRGEVRWLNRTPIFFVATKVSYAITTQLFKFFVGGVSSLGCWLVCWSAGFDI